MCVKCNCDVIVTRDEVWIGNRIYWKLTLVITINYDTLTELHAPKINVNTTQEEFLILLFYRSD
jgi:hypothetical protein